MAQTVLLVIGLLVLVAILFFVVHLWIMVWRQEQRRRIRFEDRLIRAVEKLEEVG